MAEEVKISYSSTPKGQVGPRPRKLALGSEFRFTCDDPGDLTVEFIGESPLKNGAKDVQQNKLVTAGNKPGRYPFVCILKVDGREIRLGDPADPATPAGGELELGPI